MSGHAQGERRGREAREAASGIAELEGYLLWQGELRRAEEAGERFAARLPWLTDEQRAEVARLHAAERRALAEETLRAVAARCVELRGEYTARYVLLRRRLLCVAGAVALAVLGLLGQFLGAGPTVG